MSYCVDVNILVYAVSRGAPEHASAKTFLDDCLARSEVLCLSWPTILSFLRLVTTPAVMSGRPLQPAAAMANVESLLEQPHVRVLTEQATFWTAYRETSAGLAVRGSLVLDVHLATLMRQHGVRTLYTNDSDFRRFGFLEVRNPLG